MWTLIHIALVLAAMFSVFVLMGFALYPRVFIAEFKESHPRDKREQIAMLLGSLIYLPFFAIYADKIFGR